MPDSYSEGMLWLCNAVWGILLAWFGISCPLRGSVTANEVVLSDHLYPMRKHFYPDGNSLFLDDHAPISRV